MNGATATHSSQDNPAIGLGSPMPAWGPAIALNRAEDGRAPDWIHVLPAGPDIVGRDGRRWRLSDPQAVINAYRIHAAPIALDYEHAQHHKAPLGDEAPASAWIEDMELRADGVWAKVDWTPRGRRSVVNREYRYFSPEFSFDGTSGEVEAIVGGALVNRPNLVMTALNRSAPHPTPLKDDRPMKDVMAALGLAETATSGDAVMAIAALKAEKQTALNAAQMPDLQKFVPRADYEVALNRANTAEGKLAATETQSREQAITLAIDEAIAAGKVAPASRDYFVATCRTEGGLDAFKAHVASLRSHFAASGLDRAAPATGSATALNAEQKAVCKAMGIAEDKFVAHLAERAKAEG